MVRAGIAAKAALGAPINEISPASRVRRFVNIRELTLAASGDAGQSFTTTPTKGKAHDVHVWLRRRRGGYVFLAPDQGQGSGLVRRAGGEDMMAYRALSSDPEYLKAAFRDLGLSETPGPRHNARVLQLFRASGHPEIKDDETAWCAAAVGGWLAESGYPNSGSLMARSYAKYGKACSLKAKVPRGAIIVWPRGAPPSGHVNICLEDDGTYLTCIGGNQGNGNGGGVTVSRERKSRAIAARVPASVKPVTLVDDAEPDDTKPHAAPVDAPKSGITEGAQVAGGLTVAGIAAQVWDALSSAPDAILQALLGLAQKPAFLVAVGVLGAIGFIWFQRSRMKKA